MKLLLFTVLATVVIVTNYAIAAEIPNQDICIGSDLLPGLSSAFAMVDIAKLDLLPKSNVYENGIRSNVGEFSCASKRRWISPYTNKSYLLPDEVESINVNNPLLKIQKKITIYQNFVQIKATDQVNVFLNLIRDAFANTASYQYLVECLIANYTIVDVSL